VVSTSRSPYRPLNHANVVDPFFSGAIDAWLTAEYCDLIPPLSKPLSYGLNDVLYTSNVGIVAGGYVE